jgi:hypothetical protein
MAQLSYKARSHVPRLPAGASIAGAASTPPRIPERRRQHLLAFYDIVKGGDFRAGVGT